MRNMTSLTNIIFFKMMLLNAIQILIKFLKNNYKIIYQLLIDYFINNGIKIKIIKTFFNNFNKSNTLLYNCTVNYYTVNLKFSFFTFTLYEY